MLKGPEPSNINNWVCVLEKGTEYEVELAKNYLADLDIPATVLSKRDSSLSMNIGDMSMVYLYVPKEFGKQARQALQKLNESEEDEDNRDNGEI